MPPSKKLSAVLEFGARTAASFGSTTSSISKKIGSLGETISENTKKQRVFQKEMKKLGNRNSGYFVAKRQAAALGKETEKLIRKQKRLLKLSKLQAGITRRLGKLGRNVFAGIGVAIAGSVAGLGKLVASTAAYGDELGKTSRRLGLSVDSLERMRFIAKRSGVEQQVLEKSIQKVQIALGEAARNVRGPYATAFRELGINFRKFNRLDPAKQTEELAGAFGKLTSQTEKTFLANRLWGEEGIKMLQIMEAGSGGIHEMSTAFDELGGSMGERGTKSAEKFQDTLTNLNQQVGSTFRLIAAEAMPGATRAIESLGASLRSGDVDVKAIGQSIGQMITLLGKAAEAAMIATNFVNKWMGIGGDNLAQFFGEGTGPTAGGGLSLASGVLANGRAARDRAPSSISNVTYNITQQPGEDGETFARRVAAAQKRNERQERQAGFSSAAAF